MGVFKSAIAMTLGLTIGLLLLASASAAQQKTERYSVTVLLVSGSSSEIEPAAKRFHRILSKRLRYEGLRVLNQQEHSVATGSIAVVSVPGAQAFRFRPLSAEERGCLVAVEWGATRGDFRLWKRKPLILGGPKTASGELVVVLERR